MSISSPGPTRLPCCPNSARRALRVYAIEIFGIPVRFYALSYIFGALIGWWYARRLITTPSLVDRAAGVRGPRP